jgi:hypothetical protein
MVPIGYRGSAGHGSTIEIKAWRSKLISFDLIACGVMTQPAGTSATISPVVPADCYR